MKILVFGSLCELVGQSDIVLNDIANTELLMQKLLHDFPLLQNKKFAMAVDKQMISANTVLSNDSEIALLPPFSGG